MMTINLLNGSGPRPAVEIEHNRMPVNSDLEIVRKLTQRVEYLREELLQTEEMLHEAWLRIPYDAEIVKKPWKSDIKVNCRNCGRPTLWRTAKGHAAHVNKDGVTECPPDKMGRSTVVISDEVWAAFDALDDETGETLEFITRETKKPSERENV